MISANGVNVLGANGAWELWNYVPICVNFFVWKAVRNILNNPTVSQTQRYPELTSSMQAPLIATLQGEGQVVEGQRVKCHLARERLKVKTILQYK